ncbi:MAG: hypothetical protein QM770_05465 [Tepidisphaeraceae bacterium]
MSDAALPSTQNLNVVSIKPIVTPRQLEQELPITDAARAGVVRGREVIRRILKREDPRLLVVVGPCSVHDVAAAREYAERLAKLRERVKDRFEVVMRVYFEKPRTTIGWKGLINDPHLDGSFDMNVGLRFGASCFATSRKWVCRARRNCSTRSCRSTLMTS